MSADLDLANLEETGEKLNEQVDQYLLQMHFVLLSRNWIALKEVLRTFASVSAFQTMGMVLKQEDVG